MIPSTKALKLVAIYLHICKLHSKEIKHLSQRYTNNDKADFTGQKIITLYLLVTEQRFSVSE